MQQEEIIYLLANISVNSTEEILVSSSLCTTFQFLAALNYVVHVIGIICNVISSAVLFRLPRKLAFDYCLMFLAGFDIVFLLSSSTKLLLGVFIGLQAKNLAVCMVMQCISWTASLWATVGVSTERFIVAFFVFRAKSICTYKRIVLFNMFVLCFAAVVNIPLFVVLQNINWNEDLMKNYIYLYNNYGMLIESHIPSWVFANKKLFEIFYFYVNSVLMYCLGLLAIAVLGVSVLIAIRKADKIRREMTRTQRVKRYRYRVFKGLVTVFLITYFAALSLKISCYKGVSPDLARVTESFCCFLISANASLKIIIYTSLWKDFRDTLRRSGQEWYIRKVVTVANTSAV